ncbi:hypothetical protein EJB05_33734, partial [Eragrostis curvula]
MTELRKLQALYINGCNTSVDLLHHLCHPLRVAAAAKDSVEQLLSKQHRGVVIWHNKLEAVVRVGHPAAEIRAFYVDL